MKKTENALDKKRIVKNTLLLYVRMFVMLGVSLYTSRVVLNVLGVEDFGLYNVVGGIVVFFSILNGVLSGATQRFFNFELGKNGSVGNVCGCSLTLYAGLVFLIILGGETVGLWYLNQIMNIPVERVPAANYVYQFSIVTFCLNVLKVPFNGAVIAYEKMNFFAYISILEAFLKLGIVFLLKSSPFDSLVFYSFLLSVVGLLVLLAYILYTTKTIESVKLRFAWDKKMLRQMLSFSGWSLFGSSAVISSQHGVNLILNYFCGVALNAAAAISAQVTNAMYGFISNFQVAFNPQIVKLYAQDNRETCFHLVFQASKVSFLLFWVISLPVFFGTSFILYLWLGHVPEHASQFCQLTIAFLLIDSLNGPLWTTVNATGKIKTYQILMGCVILLNVPTAIILLYCGLKPEYVWLGKVLLNGVAMLCRLLYMKIRIGFPLRMYLKSVCLPVIIVVAFSLGLSYLTYIVATPKVIVMMLVSATFAIVFSLLMGLNSEERNSLKKIIVKRLEKSRT